jgi:hypothetical protein
MPGYSSTRVRWHRLLHIQDVIDLCGILAVAASCGRALRIRTCKQFNMITICTARQLMYVYMYLRSNPDADPGDAESPNSPIPYQCTLHVQIRLSKACPTHPHWLTTMHRWMSRLKCNRFVTTCTHRCVNSKKILHTVTAKKFTNRRKEQMKLRISHSHVKIEGASQQVKYVTRRGVHIRRRRFIYFGLCRDVVAQAKSITLDMN